MVEREPSKFEAPVRFRYPAQKIYVLVLTALSVAVTMILTAVTACYTARKGVRNKT